MPKPIPIPNQIRLDLDDEVPAPIPGLAADVALFQHDRHLLGEADADESAGGDRVAVPDQPHRVGGPHDLAVMHVRKRGQRRVVRMHGVISLRDGSACTCLLVPARKRGYLPRNH